MRVGTLPRSGSTEIGTEVREPHAPARGSRADARAWFERQPVGRAARERVAAHEQQVGRVDALRHGADHELRRRRRRQVLERVHGELDAPLDERLLDLAHENALRADRAERARLIWSPDGLDDRELDVVAAARRASATVADCVRARSEPRVPSFESAASPAQRRATTGALGLRGAVQRGAQLVGELGLEPVQERLDRAIGAVVQQAAQSQAGDVREAAREHLAPGLDRRSLVVAEAL